MGPFPTTCDAFFSVWGSNHRNHPQFQDVIQLSSPWTVFGVLHLSVKLLFLLCGVHRQRRLQAFPQSLHPPGCDMEVEVWDHHNHSSWGQKPGKYRTISIYIYISFFTVIYILYT